MKLWQKVFLCTFLLFELTFNAASLYLLKHTFSLQLNKEIERGLSEQRILHSGLQANGSLVRDRQLMQHNGLRDFLRVIFEGYTRYFDQSISIEVLDSSSRIVYSSFGETVDGPREEWEGLPSDKRNYIVRDIGPNSYLFVTSKLVLNEDVYRLTYIRDITDLYRNQRTQFSLYLKLNALTAAVLAAALYLLVRYLTRSVRSLTHTARIIAEGDYTQRVQVLSQDEIGTLAQQFNRMAAAVQGKMEELKKTAANKQHFIECLTHELKTPLTSIIGYADFLRSTRYQEEIYFRGLHYIYIEGKRLESLSFKLMDLILLEKEKPDASMESIPAVCREIAESLRPRLDEAGIALVLEVEEHIRSIDKDLFKVLLINLLDNAIKASGKGSRITLRGQVSAASSGGYMLEVEDEGIGIPEADLPKVTEPFYMVDKARSRSHQGAGLGLSLCTEIVKLHGGRMEIRSSLNRGTTITVTLPEDLTTFLQVHDTSDRSFR